MATFGRVSGDVTGSVNFKDSVTASQGISGVGVQVVRDSNIWYVDKNKSNSSTGDGLSWKEAFLTVTEAIAAAGDYDIIMIGQGVYSEAATLAITQTGLKIFGSGTSGLIWGPTSLKSDTCADHLITINANGVEIAGLDFICNTDEKDAIRVATTAAIYKTHIHDCHFGGGSGEYGIYTGDTYDSVDMHVERCKFYNYATAGIRHNGTRCSYTDNVFFVPAAGIGIDCAQTGANRPDTVIIRNYIIGSNSTDTGIKIASTEPTDGTLLVANNVVTNCSTNITQDKSDAGVVNNGTYANGSSFAQVDPNAAG